MSDPTEPSIRTIRYRFTAAGHETREFVNRLDARSLALLPTVLPEYPAWTDLLYHQCPNCPLDPARHLRCPVATNLVDILDAFRTTPSTALMDIEVTTSERRYTKHAPVMEGLGALVGLRMATSGCPHLDMLRPMAITHLPFASAEETTYRAIAMYRIAQYLREQEGLPADPGLDGLVRIYEAVTTVNESFQRRVLNLQSGDAATNALFRLECYAQYTNLQLLRQKAGILTPAFLPYLAPPP